MFVFCVTTTTQKTNISIFSRRLVERGGRRDLPEAGRDPRSGPAGVWAYAGAMIRGSRMRFTSWRRGHERWLTYFAGLTDFLTSLPAATA